MEPIIQNGGQPAATTARPSKITSVARWILYILVFLTPIFFIPSAVVSFQNLKATLLFSAVVITLFLFLLSVLKTGKIEVPTHYYFFSILGVPLSVFLSALFSPSRATSFIGYGFELDTFAFIFSGFLLILLVALLFKNRISVLYSYVALISSIGILGVVAITRFLFGNYLSFFNYLGNPTVTPVGVWNNLAVVFGAGAILTLITLEMLPVKNLAKWLLRFVLILSLVILAVVNFFDVWIVLAIFSLIFFVYALSFGATIMVGSSSTDSNNRHISYHALAVLIISAMFVIAGGSLGSIISSTLNISQTTVRPTWSVTYDITKQTLKEAPIFGAGPNRFVNQWISDKPSSVNQTDFWATEFSYGVGLIPSFGVTTGILGILAWLAFFGFLVYFGFKGIFADVKDSFSRFSITSSFLLSLFFWVMAILYVPSVPVFILTFFVTGMFVAALSQGGIISFKTISLVDKPKIGFISMLGLVLLLLVVVSTGYIVVEKFIASIYYQEGVVVLNTTGDLSQAGTYIVRALQLSPNDAYLRSLADVNISQFNKIVNQSSKTTDQDALARDLQQTLGAALANLNAAKAYDATKYQNWLGLANVYDLMTQVGVTGAYDESRKAYDEVVKRNPDNPGIDLAQARLELAKGDIDAAKSFIGQALTKKPNYTDAFFLLSQIQVSDGKVDDAIASVRQASLVDPNNQGIYFQLGLLYYNKKSYSQAAGAFEEAVKIDNFYANARYFLGLSYYQLNRNQDAIAQFEAIQKTNPDNQEIALILKNLQTGKSPFTNAEPPVTDQPQSREDLPVSDSSTSNN
jgi:tetratricopeptide (TPR) repeat protein